MLPVDLKLGKVGPTLHDNTLRELTCHVDARTWSYFSMFGPNPDGSRHHVVQVLVRESYGQAGGSFAVCEMIYIS